MWAKSVVQTLLLHPDVAVDLLIVRQSRKFAFVDHGIPEKETFWSQLDRFQLIDPWNREMMSENKFMAIYRGATQTFVNM